MDVFGSDSLFGGFTAESFLGSPEDAAAHQHLLESDPTYQALVEAHQEIVTCSPVYNPLRIVAKGLHPHITKEAITAYFANFGPVMSCVLKSKRTKTGAETYALVEFATRKATNTALNHAPHMIQMVPVHVMRAFRTFGAGANSSAGPSPFPCMQSSICFQ